MSPASAKVRVTPALSSAGTPAALPPATAAALSTVTLVPWVVIDPAHIFKGKIGAGHLGVEQVTVQNLDIVKVDPELNMIVVRGAIPGPKGGLVTIKSTVKVHKVKQAGADISKNPQKASGRNPQKASARNK